MLQRSCCQYCGSGVTMWKLERVRGEQYEKIRPLLPSAVEIGLACVQNTFLSSCYHSPRWWDRFYGHYEESQSPRKSLSFAIAKTEGASRVALAMCAVLATRLPCFATSCAIHISLILYENISSASYTIPQAQIQSLRSPGLQSLTDVTIRYSSSTARPYHVLR